VHTQTYTYHVEASALSEQADLLVVSIRNLDNKQLYVGNVTQDKFVHIGTNLSFCFSYFHHGHVLFFGFLWFTVGTKGSPAARIHRMLNLIHRVLYPNSTENDTYTLTLALRYEKLARTNTDKALCSKVWTDKETPSEQGSTEIQHIEQGPHVLMLRLSTEHAFNADTFVLPLAHIPQNETHILHEIIKDLKRDIQVVRTEYTALKTRHAPKCVSYVADQHQWLGDNPNQNTSPNSAFSYKLHWHRIQDMDGTLEDIGYTLDLNIAGVYEIQVVLKITVNGQNSASFSSQYTHINGRATGPRASSHGTGTNAMAFDLIDYFEPHSVAWVSVHSSASDRPTHGYMQVCQHYAV